MGEPLKRRFGAGVPRRIAAMISGAHPAFPADAFVADALDGYEDLALMARARRIAAALARHLPQDVEEAIAILVASLGPPIEQDEITGMEPFVYLPHVFYIAQNGLAHFDASMSAQHELTKRFTAEFSIRAFIEHEPDRTLATLRRWAVDPSPHVRRLVSEGTRPRLPWAPRLRGFQRDPAPVLALLELLKDDPALYVRRSVANNLNDIGKDHPDVLVETCRRWSRDATPERAWLIRHALRSAVKRGDPGALEVLGFGGPDGLSIRSARIHPPRAAIGDVVTVRLEVESSAPEPRAVLVDIRVHFVKANGRASPRVFKGRALDLAPGEARAMEKRISLEQRTTRTHRPGRHAVEALLNGRSIPIGDFEVVPQR